MKILVNKNENNCNNIINNITVVNTNNTNSNVKNADYLKNGNLLGNIKSIFFSFKYPPSNSNKPFK